MGLLDFFAPDNREAQLGMALLAAASPTVAPHGFGERLWNGMNMYRDSQNQIEDRMLRKGLIEAQMANYQSEAEARRALAEERKTAQERERGMGEAWSRNFTSGSNWGPDEDPTGVTTPTPPSFNQSGFIRDIGRYSPMSAFNALQEMSKTRAPMVTKPGDILRDPENPSRIIAQNPADPEKDPEFVRILRAAGIQEGSPQWNAMMAQYAQTKATHAPTATVNVNQVQEKEESKTVGAGFGKTYNELMNADMAARSKLSKLGTMGQLLEGVSTGKLTPVGTELAAWAKAAGFDVDKNLPNKQAAISITNELALQARNTSGGAGMPGAMSDADREFLKAMQPSIGKDPGANRILLEINARLAKREMDVARIARDYRQRKGQLDEGFYNELDRFSKANPLFADISGSSQPKVVPFGQLPR